MNFSALRILYVGDLTPGFTCLQRVAALRDLGCQLQGIDTAAGIPKTASLWRRVRQKLCGPYDYARANRQILELVRQESFDVLWLDKALSIEAETLREARKRQPRCRIVGYALDYMTARHNQSPQFRRHLALYDLYFTTKSYGVPELLSAGCPRVEFVGNAYDPHTHRPLPVSVDERESYGGPLGFIGTWERARAASVETLARNGLSVRVWGNGWPPHKDVDAGLRIENRAVCGDEFARATCAFDINLAFLRKINRDLQTTRSVEIPACGAFMLAERTDEHRALFEEGREAEYFASDEELLDKAKYYLTHSAERRRIAEAGRERCLRSGYSYQERLQRMLQTVSTLSG